MHHLQIAQNYVYLDIDFFIVICFKSVYVLDLCVSQDLLEERILVETYLNGLKLVNTKVLFTVSRKLRNR